MIKKFKCFFIIVLLFILTGCTATYEINIKSNKIVEKMKVLETNVEYFDYIGNDGLTLKEQLKSFTSPSIYAEEQYKVNMIDESDKIGFNYSSSNFDSILDSSVIKYCYVNPSLRTNDKIVTIDTGTNFKCFDYYDILESIKVVVKSDYKIISSNADEIDGNKYIWYITRDSDKRIKISYDSSDIRINTYIYVIPFVLVFLVLLASLLAIKKFRKNNKV